jgi:hypothetical protein
VLSTVFFEVAAIGSSLYGMLWAAGAWRGISVPPSRTFEAVLLGLGLAVALNLVRLLTTATDVAGHMIVGRLVGFRFRSVSMYRVLLTSTRRGLRLRRAERATTNVAFRVVGERRIVARYILYLAGGPLTTLALAGVMWPVARRYLIGGAGTHSLIGFASIYLVVIGFLMFLAIGLLGALPWRIGNSASDGGKILAALQRPAQARRIVALSGLGDLTVRGVRPRLWPAAQVTQALTPEDDTVFTGIAWINAYEWWHDRGEVTRAGEYLDRLRGSSPAAQRARVAAPLMPLEIAYFLARYRYEPAAARAWLDADVKGPSAAFMRLRAEAAIFLAEDLPTQALDAATRGLAELERARVASQRQVREIHAETEAEDLQALAQSARASLAAASGP